ncbi:MAG: DEAD/DEAH box helicase [Limnochordales bacterium]|nr:DEAD/DEAH box helicase [Limnochordales bacterium]
MGNGTVMFHPIVEEWFAARFGAPTPPQAAGWPAIQQGENVLIVAPTGSGKTFAGFLVFIDRLLREREREREGESASDSPANPHGGGVRVVYISPLRALDNDIHRNLTPALTEISQLAEARLPGWRPLRAAVRTGDTSPAERRRQLNHPPDLLITTPESLFLLMVSPRGRQILRTVEAVIVDELHALAANKRGVQLALTLEWLEWWTAKPLQRVGLSATQRPISRLATFLAGKRPVTVIDTGLRKGMDLVVDIPAPDLAAGRTPEGSIWPSIYRKLHQLIESERQAARSTLVFVNSRAQAERVTARLNQLASETDPEVGRLAAAHHGSLSRNIREKVEKNFQRGELPAVVATGSLELGIDIGLVDLVVQVESPHAVTRGLQRVGRAGHLFGARSRGVILAKTRMDLLEAAVVGEAILHADIEPIALPRAPLDVLAQQVAAMVACDDWSGEGLYRLVKQAGPYLSLTRSAFRSVLRLLAGGFRHPLLTRLRPRLVWDEEADLLRGLPGTRLVVLRGSGTIPDRGTYAVYTVKDRRHLGELDEEFVFETRRGDVVLLGTTACRVERIEKDRVLVEPLGGAKQAAPALVAQGTGERLQLAQGPLVRLPFWRGEGLGRSTFLGLRVGRFLREVEGWIKERGGKGALSSGDAQTLGQQHDQLAAELAAWLKRRLPLTEAAAAALADHLLRQYERVGALPSDRCVLVEEFPDVNGDPLIVIHSPFGSRVNRAWRLALADALAERWGVEAEILATDDGLLLRLPGNLSRPAAQPFLQQLVHLVGPDEVESRIWRSLQGSALLGSAFRAAAGRALLLSRGLAGRRVPLWLQRLQAQDLWEATRHFADFPIMLEAVREVFQENLDVPALRAVLHGIERGRIRVVPVVSRYPTPFTAGLLFDYAGAFIYDTDEPRAAASARPGVAREISWVQGTLALTGGDLRSLLDQEVLEELRAEMGQERAGEGEEEATGARAEPGAGPGAGPAAGPGARAMAGAGKTRATSGCEVTEREPTEERVREYALIRGPFTLDELAEELGADSRFRDAVTRLVACGELAVGCFREAAPASGSRNDRGTEYSEYCHVDFLRVWERRTLARRRRQAVAVPFSRYLYFLLRRHLSAADGGLANALHPLLGLPFGWDSWCHRLLGVRLPKECGEWGAGRTVSLSPTERLRAREVAVMAGLAELGRAGHLIWQVRGGPSASEPMVIFWPPPEPRETDADLDDFEPADGRAEWSSVTLELWQTLRRRGALFLYQLENAWRGRGADGAGSAGSTDEVRSALARLFLQGLITSDSPQPLAVLPQLAALAQGGKLPEPEPALRSEFAPWPVVRGISRSPRTRRALREAKRRAQVAVERLMMKPAGAAETALSDGRWWVLGQVGMDAGRWLDQVLELYGVVTPSVWAAFRRLVGESSRPSPDADDACPELAFPAWSVVYEELRRREWQGSVLRGSFVEELDDPQFMRAADVGKLAVTDEEETAELLLVSAADPVNPYGLLLGWPGIVQTEDESQSEEWSEPVRPGEVGRQLPLPLRREAPVWLLFHLHKGEATLLLAYAARNGLLRVWQQTWQSLTESWQVAAARALRRLFSLEPVVASAGKLAVTGYEEVGSGSPAGQSLSVWGSPVERPLREAGFRSAPRGLVLYAVEE